MTDSKNKQKNAILNNFEDDLDAMFDEASLNDESLQLDDEDELDRLLMGDKFEKTGSSTDNEDDIDKLLKSAEKESKISKLPNDAPKKSAKQDIDSLLDKVSDNLEKDNLKTPKVELSEANVFAELDDFDEFASFDDEPSEKSIHAVAEESKAEVASAGDDFDEFDIFDEDFGLPKSVEPVAPVKAEQVKTVTPKNEPETIIPPNPPEEVIEVSVESSATMNDSAIDDFEMNFDDAFSEQDDVPKQVVSKPAAEMRLDAESEDELKGAIDSNDEMPEDDFLIADFDITSDDEINPAELDLDEGIEPTSAAFEEVSDGLQDAFSELEGFIDEETKPELIEPVAVAPLTQPVQEVVESPNELLNQISALWAAQDLLKQQFAATATAMGPSETVANELDMLTKEQKSLRKLMEHSAKKVPGIVYGGIVLGALALLLSGGLLAMYFKSNSEFEALQEQNVVLEKELASLKSGGLTTTGEDVKTSIAGLSQQVEQIQEQLTALDKTSQIDALQASVVGLKVDLNNLMKKGVELNAQAALSAPHVEHEVKVEHISEPKAEHLTESTIKHDVNVEHKPESKDDQKTEPTEQHEAKVEHQHESKEELKVELPVEMKQEKHAEIHAEAATTTPATEEKSHTAEAEPVLATKQAESSAGEKTAHKVVVEKTPPKAAEKPTGKVITERPNRLIASVEKKSKPKPIAVLKEESYEGGRWTANLVSFRQDWYAKRKAVEFAQRGIIVNVIPVEVKGETWYRLRAGGFSNRAEASNYAAKAKKQLNLTSVWVTSE